MSDWMARDEEHGILVWTARDEEHLSDYLRFMEEHGSKVGSMGDASQGEIQILTDPERAKACVLAMRGRLSKRSDMTDERLFDWTRLGEVYQDQYARIVRFPVMFPNGALGTYLIWFWHAEFGRKDACCAMPVMPDGKICLLKTYRHATRTWTLEFPRGGTEPGKSIFDALRKEVKEEAGFDIGEIVSLGEMEPDNGILSSVLPVFMVKVIAEGNTAIEYAEAISGKVFFTPDELAVVLKQQQHSDGIRTYRVRGSWENFAFAQARMRGLI